MQYQDFTPMEEFQGLSSIPPKYLAHHRPQKILIVDDEFDVRMALAENLVGAGYKVSTAKNGEDALNYLKSEDVLPDYILLDMNMPIKDGLTFIHDRSRLEEISEIPTIVMSGDIERRNGLHDEEFLAKPFFFSEVLEALKKVSNKARGD